MTQEQVELNKILSERIQAKLQEELPNKMCFLCKAILKGDDSYISVNLENTKVSYFVCQCCADEIAYKIKYERREREEAQRVWEANHPIVYKKSEVKDDALFRDGVLRRLDNIEAIVINIHSKVYGV